jgi:nucleoside-diphosphate-sugar epimerase
VIEVVQSSLVILTNYFLMRYHTNMKKNILIFGGTQYVGKQLLNLLHAKGHNLTVATRGNFPPPLSKNINTIKLDRYDPSTFPKEIDKEWDIVIDQLSFFGEEAKVLVDFFQDKAKRYIVTSSSAVYDESKNACEKSFNPKDYKFNLHTGTKREIVHGGTSYQDGKRESEAYYIQNVKNCTLVRFPQIFGEDDLSNRLLEVILHITRNKKIPISNKDKLFSFIHSRDAARFLSWIVDNPIQGPINASSDGIETIKSLMNYLDGDEALIEESKGNELPIFQGKEVVLNINLAKSKGFIFEENSVWINAVSKTWKYYIQYIQSF